jgi:hypothetical protein
MQQCPSTIFLISLQPHMGSLPQTQCAKNNLAFLAAYNPQDPPELLFKQCTNCKKITALEQNPYTT